MDINLLKTQCLSQYKIGDTIKCAHHGTIGKIVDMDVVTQECYDEVFTRTDDPQFPNKSLTRSGKWAEIIDPVKSKQTNYLIYN